MATPLPGTGIQVRGAIGGGLSRLRRAAGTPPGRLRVAGAVLAGVVLLFGAVTAWQVDTRAEASGRLLSSSGPLSQDAAEIYRSLADADTAAASGFLLAAQEPPELRKRYEDDLATASGLLARAAARTTASSEAQRWVAELNRQLPQYAGLVETARANNRLGLPLGSAYLRYASALMQDSMLPSAQRLVDAESRQLKADYAEAKSVPWAALVLAVLALGVLGRYQLAQFRRTNRVFNPGLVAATGAVLAVSGWLAVGGVAARVALDDSWRLGARPLQELDRVRIAALQAHTAENLDLVARGGSELYGRRWTDAATPLAGPTRMPGSIAWAVVVTSGPARGPMEEAEKQFAAWQARHGEAAEKSARGEYDAALGLTLGGPDTAAGAFGAMDQAFGRAAVADRQEFERAADGVAGGLEALAAGAGVLAVLAAVGVARGVGRRLAEYR
ncbi:hypothetical protein [Kitasatospora camelliae]|uniref:Secreted protein n=1 Tax=Kitasatospora camelliae TaxID=3156397 RepID=A0AAU8JZ87_9ACTN